MENLCTISIRKEINSSANKKVKLKEKECETVASIP